MLLRDYQLDGIDKLLAAFAAEQRVIAQCPTAGGKTVLAAALIKQLNWPVLVTAHRKELLAQFRAALATFGVTGVHVESIQALARGHPVPIDPRIIIIDECHRSEAQSYRDLVDRFPAAQVLGLTATPERLDRKSLLAEHGGTYNRIVEIASVVELANGGHIMLPKIYTSPEALSLEGVSTIGGDYNAGQLERRMATQVLCVNIVTHYQKMAGDRQAVVFCVGIQHAMMVKERFQHAGVSARAVHGRLSDPERDEVLASFARREYRVLVNIDICTEGWDYPPLECIILATPTKSRTKYMQAIGRCMRTWDGKRQPLVLDHAGCAHDHGRPEDPYDYLAGNSQKARAEAGKPKGKHCPKCHQVMPPGAERCDCGHVFEGKPPPEETADALVEMEGPPIPSAQEFLDDFCRILDDKHASVSSEVAYYAHQKGWINDWQHTFYVSILRFRKLSDKQRLKKSEVNRAILKGSGWCPSCRGWHMGADESGKSVSLVPPAQMDRLPKGKPLTCGAERLTPAVGLEPPTPAQMGLWKVTDDGGIAHA